MAQFLRKYRGINIPWKDSEIVGISVFESKSMYNKFIVTQTGTLVFGIVHLHRDLIPEGEQTCKGGGLWKIDNQRGCILLYGRSFDFGAPDLDCVKRMDTSRVESFPPYPMFYQRQWLDEEILEPVVVAD